MNSTEQQILNRQHSESPEIGDYWHEMFTPVAVVVDVTPFCVVTVEKIKPLDSRHSTWDLEATPNIYARREFRWRWTYGRIGNHSFEGVDHDPGVKNKCWCWVIPKHQPWVREHLEAMNATVVAKP